MQPDEVFNDDELVAIINNLVQKGEGRLRLFVLGRAVQIAQRDSGSQGLKALELVLSLAQAGESDNGHMAGGLDVLEGLDLAEMEMVMGYVNKLLNFSKQGDDEPTA